MLQPKAKVGSSGANSITAPSTASIELPSFDELLSTSLNRESHTKAWCDICKRYQPTVQSKILNRLPLILNINANVITSEDCEFWRMERGEVISRKEGPSPPKDPNILEKPYSDPTSSKLELPTKSPAFLPWRIALVILPNGSLVVHSLNSTDLDILPSFKVGMTAMAIYELTVKKIA